MLEEKKLKLETLKQESSFHKATLDSIAARLNNPNPRKELRVSFKEDSSLNRKSAENPGLCVQSRERFGGSRIEEQTLVTSARGKDLEVKWKNPRRHSFQQFQERNIGATSFLTSSHKVWDRDQFSRKGGHLGLFGGHHKYLWNVGQSPPDFGQFDRDGDKLERKSYISGNDNSQSRRNIGHLEQNGIRGYELPSKTKRH